MTDAEFLKALANAHKAVLTVSINARDHTCTHFANRLGSIFGSLDAVRTAIEREHTKGKDYAR